MAEDRRARLEELRDHFHARLSDAADRDATAIGRLLKDIDTDLANLPSATEVSAADEIAARRAARRSGPPSKARTQRSG